MMKVRILIVEDDATMQHLMATILGRQGLECTVVKDGRSAVEVWERDGFEFVFMDVQMPIMDGLEATRLIREKEAEKGGHTVIIATTAFAMESDREMCLEAGMDGFLTKPLDLDELLQLVEIYRKKGRPSGNG